GAALVGGEEFNPAEKTYMLAGGIAYAFCDTVGTILSVLSYWTDFKKYTNDAVGDELKALEEKAWSLSAWPTMVRFLGWWGAFPMGNRPGVGWRYAAWGAEQAKNLISAVARILGGPKVGASFGIVGAGILFVLEMVVVCKQWDDTRNDRQMLVTKALKD